MYTNRGYLVAKANTDYSKLQTRTLNEVFFRLGDPTPSLSESQKSVLVLAV